MTMKRASMLLAAGLAVAACQLDPRAGETQGDTGDDSPPDGNKSPVLTLTQSQYDEKLAKDVKEQLNKIEEGKAAARRDAILSIANLLAPGDTELKAKAEKAVADETVTIDAFRKEAREHVADKSKPVANVTVGIDGQDKLNAAVTLSVVCGGDPALVQAIDRNDERSARVASGLGFGSVADFRNAHRTLMSSGMHSRKLSQLLGFTIAESHRMRYFQADVNEQFRMLATHGTSHFPALLENIANKTVLGTMALATTTWQNWCGIASTSDFKDAAIVSLSNLQMLAKVPEYGLPEMLFGSDRGVKNRVYKYMGKVAFTIESLRNDDKGALTLYPRIAALAAAHGPEALVCGMVNNGESEVFQGDTAVVVSTTRGNKLSTAALTPDSAELADIAISDQVDFGEGKMPIAVEGAFLLVPPKLKGVAARIYNDNVNWAYSGTSGDKPSNQMKGRLRPMVSPYFGGKVSGGSDTRWSVVADPAMAPAIVISFLDGQQVPTYTPVDMGTSTMIGGELMFAYGAAYAHPEAIVQNPGA